MSLHFKQKSLMALGNTADTTLSDEFLYDKLTIKVKVSTISNAGTDDPVYITLFGPRGSSDKIRLDSPADDFERGKVSTFVIYDKYSFLQNLRNGIGEPYAISIEKTGSDGVFIEYVDVILGLNAATKSMRFNFDGALGNKGDFKLAAARKGVYLFFNGISQPLPTQKSILVDEVWFVIDNRYSAIPFIFNEKVMIKVLKSMYYGVIVDIENKTHVSFSASNNSWFGPNYKFTVSNDFTYRRQVSESDFTSVEVAQEMNFGFEVPAGQLYMRPYKIIDTVSFQTYKIGNTDINLLSDSFKPNLLSKGSGGYTFLKGDDITDQNLRNIYRSIIGHEFVR
jgi:PLAT/LH2 domain